MNDTQSDLQLKHNVEAELAWDPRINASQIAVSADQGAVSLLGTVDTYAEMDAAAQATRRVNGVRAVAQNLTVKLLPHHQQSDADITAGVLSSLQWDVVVPSAVTASVERGIVTLRGEVHWNFQRHEAEQAVRHHAGVIAVNNAITLKPKTSASKLKEDVQAALQRQATTDANSIHIETSGGKVTLTGHAASWQSIADAANAAWAAPGVTDVVSQVKVMAPG